MKIRFNIITASNKVEDASQYLHCAFHPGTRLTSIDSSGLRCPECGNTYTPRDASHETEIKSRYSKTAPKIVQAKKQKKRRDSLGNKVPDDMARDLTIGQTIVYYDEQTVSSQSKSN